MTVCPPKNSFLNLNYDIEHSDEMKLDNVTRMELFEFALDVVQEEFFYETMKNLSKLEDPDRNYNWYHGYTWLTYPYYDYENNQLRYFVMTTATSGNISTKNFGDKFNADKVDGNIFIGVQIHVPPSVMNDRSTALLLNLKKNTIKEDSDKM